jgi:exopolyphosphatase/guanosine-5'-triphosphate,3'-diphosphate pyrophosphatase
MTDLLDPLLLAAVDLGSNSFRLLIGRADSSPAGVQVIPVDVLKDSVRLASGLDQERNLTPLAQRRGVEALQRFGERLRAFHPDSVRAVATSTLRQAKNARHVLATFEAALGFPIEVIAGREEARLIWIGAAHTLPADGSHRLVIDIGGGSTECIVGRD